MKKCILVSCIILVTGCGQPITNKEVKTSIREECEQEKRSDSVCNTLFIKDIRDILRNSKILQVEDIK